MNKYNYLDLLVTFFAGVAFAYAVTIIAFGECMFNQEVNKMEFEEINPGVWKHENEGDSIEGVYVKKAENMGLNNSNAYYLEKDGQQWLVWGTKILDDRMSFVQIGEYVKVEYKGKVANKVGQDVKLYTVLRRKS